MLRLYLGRAGSGKTSYILRELKKTSDTGIGGNVLIVPEQYSHDCERALAGMGDQLCLHAEVLSFTRLASRVFAETGGLAVRSLDSGGRVLAMSRAYMEASPRLRVYDVGFRRPDFIKKLLATYDELKVAELGGADLMSAAESAGGDLGSKLSDLALIFELFEAVKERGGADIRDTLERLAEDIGKSSVGASGRVYADGFTDFTYQELRVLEGLLKKGADVTVALNCGDLSDTDLTFRLTVKTANRLINMATEHGSKVEILRFPERDGKDPALKYLERNLTDYSAPLFEGDNSRVDLVRCAGVAEECAMASARALEIVRAGGRFRDIAVVSPVWGAYGPVADGVFKRYGVPLTRTQMTDILEKPVMALVTGALDIISNNWDYASVFRYLKTDLAGIAPEDRDVLENYVLKWNIRGEAAWTREGGWSMSPEGYGKEPDDRVRQELERINELRASVAAPVAQLHRALKNGEGATDKARAVYAFMEEIGLYGTLEAKAAGTREGGDMELAQEYRQLWDITVGALQQFSDILADTPVEVEEFIRLLKLTLGQYKVGVIPALVDSVRAGDMSRIRARGVKHLIVLGATDDSLPQRPADAGVFSDDEREELRALGIDTLDDRDDAVARELMGVYASLTVPSESLTLTYPEGSRPSYVITRLKRLFGKEERRPGEEIYTASPEAAFELAASGQGDAAAELRAYFESRDEWRERLEAVKRAGAVTRGSLDGNTARRLYGGKLSLSPSRIDKYYSCRYAYFLQYGLKAKARQEAALDAPEAGTFIHFILERVAREASRLGGFDKISEQDITKLIPGLVREYANTRLGGLENKSGRFRYLYGRLAGAAGRIALAMREELCRSDFVPMDFELRFAPDGDLPPVMTEEGDSVTGVADRVDGWVKDGRLYLRVVDYKTGRKSMDLRDVYYGIGLQMLIYLFALKREGKDRYGMEIVPAGVLYSPARDEYVRSDRDLDGEELEKAREKLIRQSGLILDDPEVIEAMERGEKRRLPVTVSSRTGELKGSIADAAQLGKLARRVDTLIGDMAREIRSGALTANPYLRSRIDSACMYCPYCDACRFVDGQNGERYRRLSKLQTAEIWKLLEEAGK